MELEAITPKEVGLDSTRLLKARDYAQKLGEQLGASGGAAMVIRHDRIAGEWYWGRRGFAEDSKPFDAQTLVPYCSVTKGITGTALALTIQDGALWLDEPAYRYLPELGKGDRKESAYSLANITVRHFATHSSGFPAGDPDWYQSFRCTPPGEHPSDTYVRCALSRVTRGLSYEPGTAHIYSDPGVCLLGELIYRAGGKRVPDLIRERIIEPLGLKNIGWDFDDELAKNISFSAVDDWKGSPVGVKQARQIGAAWGGLIGNCRDLAMFGLVLLHEGELGGVRVMAPLTVRMMTSTQMPLPARPQFPHRGLLWWIKAAPDSPELGHIVPYGTYCHGGSSHCLLVVMPALDIVAVMLRNRVGDSPGFLYPRDYPVFMDLVAASVDEL